MRVLIALVGVLLFFPTQAPAEVISLFYFNSTIEFGPDSVRARAWDRQHGIFVDDTLISELDNPIMQDGFLATEGPVVEHELLKDSNGVVVQSNYFYAGGQIDFGTFSLPIESYGLWVPELGHLQIEIGPQVGASGGDIYFTFGAGLLDPDLAAALGTSRRIVGGQGGTNVSYARCGELGDYLSSKRVTCDGATWIELQVPEPSHVSLVAAGLAWFIARRRRRV